MFTPVLMDVFCTYGTAPSWCCLHLFHGCILHLYTMTQLRRPTLASSGNSGGHPVALLLVVALLLLVALLQERRSPSSKRWAPAAVLARGRPSPCPPRPECSASSWPAATVSSAPRVLARGRRRVLLAPSASSWPSPCPPRPEC